MKQRRLASASRAVTVVAKRRKMLPKKCRSFPKDRQHSQNGQDYASIFGSTLRAELGGSHQSVKTIMRWTGAQERTIKNWLAGTNCPNGEHLIELIRHSDAVCNLVLRVAGRDEALAAFQVAYARQSLMAAVAELDRLDHP